MFSETKGSRVTERYRIRKNGQEVYVVGSEAAECLTLRCQRDLREPHPILCSTFLGMAVLAADEARNVVAWPTVTLALGDRLEIEVTGDKPTLKPSYCWPAGPERPPLPRALQEGEKQLICSFCKKESTEVRAMVEGPGDTNICDECTRLCWEIVLQHRERHSVESLLTESESSEPASHGTSTPSPEMLKDTGALRPMENYRVRKNGEELFVMGSPAAETIALLCTRSLKDTQQMATTEFRSMAILRNRENCDVVHWPAVDLELGDRLEIEITNDKPTLAPTRMYPPEPKMQLVPRQGTEGQEEVTCSFCETKAAQVEGMIVGPGDTNICDKCVALCQQIIQTRNQTNPPESLRPET